MGPTGRQRSYNPLEEIGLGLLLSSFTQSMVQFTWNSLFSPERFSLGTKLSCTMEDYPSRWIANGIVGTFDNYDTLTSTKALPLEASPVGQYKCEHVEYDDDVSNEVSQSFDIENNLYGN